MKVVVFIMNLNTKFQKQAASKYSSFFQFLTFIIAEELEKLIQSERRINNKFIKEISELQLQAAAN